jgi:hypothetical protein
MRFLNPLNPETGETKWLMLSVAVCVAAYFVYASVASVAKAKNCSECPCVCECK